MNDILVKVQTYLESATRGKAGMTPAVLAEATKAFYQALDRQFNNETARTFRPRMSNLGRPLCQLQHEQRGAPAEPMPYNQVMKFLFGDVLEIIAIAVMRSAGVNVESVHDRVTLTLKDGEFEAEIPGTDDITIDAKIWDIKSASKFAFEGKFSSPDGFDKLISDDAFGYVPQGMGYGKGKGLPFGGWIAINKETGEWAVLEVPEDRYSDIETQSLAAMTSTAKALAESGTTSVEKCFTDVVETWYKKPTGNRVLCTTCSYCQYKWECWPNLKYRQHVKSPNRHSYYTYVSPEWLEGSNPENDA